MDRIYSLGATLYRAVSGKGPPDAIVRANAALEGKDDPLVPAAVLGKDEYSSIFLEALDSSLGFLPEKRPQTIEDWRAMFPQADASVITSGRLIESAATARSSEAATVVNESPGVTGGRGRDITRVAVNDG